MGLACFSTDALGVVCAASRHVSAVLLLLLVINHALLLRQ
jgi:hypothetical protein